MRDSVRSKKRAELADNELETAVSRGNAAIGIGRTAGQHQISLSNLDASSRLMVETTAVLGRFAREVNEFLNRD